MKAPQPSVVALVISAIVLVVCLMTCKARIIVDILYNPDQPETPAWPVR